MHLKRVRHKHKRQSTQLHVLTQLESQTRKPCETLYETPRGMATLKGCSPALARVKLCLNLATFEQFCFCRRGEDECLCLKVTSHLLIKECPENRQRKKQEKYFEECLDVFHHMRLQNNLTKRNMNTY